MPLWGGFLALAEETCTELSMFAAQQRQDPPNS